MKIIFSLLLCLHLLMGICQGCGENEMLCPDNFDAYGNPTTGVCMEMKYYEGINGTQCMGTCPTNCPPGSETIPGGVDMWGCREPDLCEISVHVCTKYAGVICGPYDIRCPGPTDSNGCSGPDSCTPREYAGANSSFTCPGFCETTCGPDEMFCPGPTYYGCSSPGFCISIENEGVANGNSSCPRV